MGCRDHDRMLCNQCLSSPLMLWVWISIRARCTTLCDKVCQWPVTGRWFSPCPPVSSTNNTVRHDITIHLKQPPHVLLSYLNVTATFKMHNKTTISYIVMQRNIPYNNFDVLRKVCWRGIQSGWPPQQIYSRERIGRQPQTKGIVRKMRFLRPTIMYFYFLCLKLFCFLLMWWQNRKTPRFRIRASRTEISLWDNLKLTMTDIKWPCKVSENSAIGATISIIICFFQKFTSLHRWYFWYSLNFQGLHLMTEPDFAWSADHRLFTCRLPVLATLYT